MNVARIRVELGLRAERDGPLLVDVPDRRSRDRWHAGDVGRLTEEHVERARESSCPGVALGEVADDDVRRSARARR